VTNTTTTTTTNTNCKREDSALLLLCCFDATADDDDADEADRPTNEQMKMPRQQQPKMMKMRYTLDQLLPKEMKLPPLSSIYKM
jgi:hypothetical protein